MEGFEEDGCELAYLERTRRAYGGEVIGRAGS